MTDTSAQFVTFLKEENTLEAMNVIKAALTEQTKAVLVATKAEVAHGFKLTEKEAEKKEPEGEPEKNPDGTDKEPEKKDDM